MISGQGKFFIVALQPGEAQGPCTFQLNSTCVKRCSKAFVNVFIAIVESAFVVLHCSADWEFKFSDLNEQKKKKIVLKIFKCSRKEVLSS